MYQTSTLIGFGFLNSVRKKSWSETSKLLSLQLQLLLLVGVQGGREAAPVQLVPSHPPVTPHSRMHQMISEYFLLGNRWK